MITVDLTPIEARAHKLAQGLHDDMLEAHFVRLLQEQGEFTPEAIKRRASLVAEAARRARYKIEQAQRYTIRVVPNHTQTHQRITAQLTSPGVRRRGRRDRR